ncbi:type VII secretion protein EccB [Kitasatospora sp. LaBMicrA B282]|uniref:type VII secretion protein EccB n=1 Tax=Kitasatospora sp. LaBMicrA B282 TaxID=3420949 RepID=UPI003D114825
MQSKRDQVQAHLFVMSRLATGMLRGEPDAPDTPVGRTSRGTVIGMILGALIALGVTLYGVVVPGGATGWRKPGTLVMVDETGARFLYLNGALHPVPNETSAKLLAGDQMAVDQVSESSLAGTPRGAPIGIVGAPDSLPTPADLVNSPWLSCAVVQPTATGGAAPQLTLAVGPAQEGTRLAGDQGLLIVAPDNTQYLLWHGQRLRLDTKGGAVQALGYAAATPYPVTAAFLDTLAAGPDLAAPAVDGQGSAGPQLAGQPSRIGQLFTGPRGDHYLLTATGLVPLGGTAFALLSGDPQTQRIAYAGAAVQPAAIGPDDLAAHGAPAADAARWAAPGLPDQPPTLVTPGQGQAVCADVQASAGAPVTAVSVLDAAAIGGQPPAVQPGVQPSCTAADRIAVRPGGGALVRALSGAGTGATVYLVSDGGVKYPLASAAVVKQLGYGASVPAAVPEGLLALLPSGPSLDPALLAGGGVVVPPAAKVGC